jgi:hypothetical protein
MRHILALIILITSTSQTYSQVLKKHQGKDRLVLVVATSEKSTDFINQIEHLNQSLESLKERKVTVYSVLPKKYRITNSTNKDWVYSSELYKTYKSADNYLTFILIGLDGSIKLRRQQLINMSELFNIIDSMPMRKSEMRQKN